MLDTQKSALQKLDYVQAPNGARLQASGLDTVFAAALSQFASVILAKVIIGDFELIATILVTVLYYALPLTLNGQTLGKKIYGLRVLPSDDDRALSWKEALMRETVGKALSYFTLCAGFFMILWRDDRRALHDLLSKTVVVQDAAVAERRSGFFAGFAKSILVSTVLVLASLSYFYHSSFIADRIEAQLTAQGLKVSDVSGSPAKGFLIDGLEIVNDKDKMNFGKLNISFTDYAKIFAEQTLTFETVRFTDASMTISEGKGEDLLLGLIALPFIETDASARDSWGRQKFQFKKIVLKNLTAENTKVIDRTKSLEIKSVQVTELVIDPKTKNSSWESLRVRSSLVDLDTHQAKFYDGAVDFSSALTVKLYEVPGIKLKQPVDLVAAFSFSKGKFNHLQINALANKVTLTAKDSSDYQLWVASLAPSEYFDELPFDRISFYSAKASPLELLTGAPKTASFEIGSANFIYQHQTPTLSDPTSIFASLLGSRIEARYQTTDAAYSLTLPPGFLSTLVMGEGKIELSSSHGLNPEDILYRLGARNTQAITKFFVSPARLPATQQ